MRRALQRVRAVVRRVLDLFPFTALGLLVLGASAYSLFEVGLKRADLILLIIGAMGLGMGAIALLATSFTALGLWLQLRKVGGGDKLGMECGFSTRSGFSVSTLWFIPFVKLGWSWLNPVAVVELKKHNRRFHEVVTPTRRGLCDEVVRKVDIGDAFGLTKISFRMREERDVRFYPSVGNLRKMDVVRSIASGEDMPHPGGQPEGERADLRRYNPGDPVRFILWKVFAKTREIVIRTPERAIAPARPPGGRRGDGAGDEAAAGAARVAIEAGSLGTQWVLGADGADEPAKHKIQALEVLARSGNCDDEQAGAGLSRFLQKHAATGGARVVVFVPPKPGPWLEKVMAAAKARSSPTRGSPVEFVVCMDGMIKSPKTSWLGNIALDAATPENAQPGMVLAKSTDVSSVINTLAATRSNVVLIDRRAGRVFGEGHRRALGAA